MTALDSSHVRAYYERHTRAFLWFGQGGRFGIMHRPVFAPGVSTRADAFRYVENRIVDLLQQQESAARHVVDLGCGVGASLCHIARRLRVAGTGVTVSPTQAALARTRVAAAGLDACVVIVEADYLALPDAIPSADLVYAIESFAHTQDPARFLTVCRGLVRPGGLLVICDDFQGVVSAPEAAAAVAQFQRGWHVPTILEPARLAALAGASGFVHESTADLSPYLRLGRPRDRLADIVAALVGRLPVRWDRLDPWLGGSALQACLRQGWIKYLFVVLRRQ